MKLYEKSRYIAPYDWLINQNIQEWDLKKANISILRTLNLITEKEYDDFVKMPRMQREVALGCLRRDNLKIEEGYQVGITTARRLFLEKNKIDVENVLYIDNDSITTVYSWSDKRANYIDGRIAPLLEFRLKNRYTSLYRIFMIDFLYFNNGEEERCRFKNVDDSKLKQTHTGFFVDFLLSVAYSAQNNSLIETIDLVKNVYKDYCSKKMDVRYYREFNTDNKYKVATTEYYTYYSDFVEEYHKPLLDISFNASIIRLLNKIFMTEYFRKSK